MVNRDALKLAETFITSQLGSISDLPKELANTIANVYYKYSLLSLELSDIKSRNGFIPNSMQSRLFKETPQDLFTEYYQNQSKIMSDVEAVYSFVDSLRKIDRGKKPNLYKASADFILDCLKFNIKSAGQKTGLRRMMERKFKKVDEIPDLINHMSFDDDSINNEDVNTQDSIPAIDVLCVIISRDEINRADVSPALSTLQSLLGSAYRIAKYQNCVSLSVHGYDNDSRELFEIDEVRSYFRELDRKFPYWFYFINKEDETLLWLTMCLCSIRTVSPGSTFIDPDDLGRFLEYHFGALNHLFDQHGIPEEQNEEISEAVISYFEKAKIMN